MRATSLARSRLVPAISWKSLCTSWSAPTGRKRFSSIALSSMACSSSPSSPISSRNSRPLAAVRSRPARSLAAPVKAPLTWPNRVQQAAGKIIRLGHQEHADLHHVGAGRDVDPVFLVLGIEGIVPGEIEQCAVDLLEVPRVVQLDHARHHLGFWRHRPHIPGNLRYQALVAAVRPYGIPRRRHDHGAARAAHLAQRAVHPGRYRISTR